MSGPRRPEAAAPSGARACLLAAAIMLVAFNLRPAIVEVGPLIGEIRAGTGLSGAGAGILTTLPVLCFGLLAPLAPRLARRFGTDRVIGAMLVGLAFGIVVRSLPTLLALFVGTVAIGSVIAIVNVLLPSVIKRDFGLRAGPVLGLYATALSLGPAVAAGTVVPLQHALGIGWRAALLLVLPAVLAAVAVWALAVRAADAPGSAAVRGPGAPRSSGVWRDPIAWGVTGFMGMTSLQFYGAFAWFPSMLSAHGVSDLAAGWWLALMGLVGVLGSLVVPPLATRGAGQGRYAALIVGLYVAGWCGMLVAPASGAPVWAVLLGFAQGGGIGLALTLMVVRASTATAAADLSGMAQSIGYPLAALGPFLLGALHDLSGAWTASIVLMLATLVPLLVAGVVAGRPQTVGYDRPRA